MSPACAAAGDWTPAPPSNPIAAIQDALATIHGHGLRPRFETLRLVDSFDGTTTLLDSAGTVLAWGPSAVFRALAKPRDPIVFRGPLGALRRVA